MNKLVSLLLLLILFINGTLIIAYNPVSASVLVENSWTTKTSMSEPRWDMGVVKVDGKIYVIGGRPATPGVHSDNVGVNEVYDPKTDKWTTLAPMPTPRESFTIFEYQNKIYCIGGLVRVPDYGGIQMVNVDVTEVYDIASDKWSTISTSFNVGGDTYVVNGQIFVLSYNQLYKYDVAADSWAVQTLPDGRFPFICEKSNVGREQSDKLVALTVYVYDSKTGKWSDGTTGFAGSYGSIVGVTSGSYAPKKVYVFGRDWDMLLGEVTSESFWPVTHVYDPVADVWSTAMAPSTLFDLCCVVNVDDILYVIGGSVNEQYIPLGYHGTAIPDLSESNSSFLTYSVIVAIVLTVGIVVVSVIYVIFRKKAPKRKIETEQLSTMEKSTIRIKKLYFLLYYDSL
jgi:hypothetical protein